MSTWNDPELIRLFSTNTPLIDVRAEVEFSEGAIPNSINLPIMRNNERAQVGTCYKQHGQAEAIALGHKLVSGRIKEERVSTWIEFLNQNPTAEIFCFRGGLRSQISCQWVKEAGIDKRPVPGGYKRMRKFFLSWLDDAPLSPLIRIGGLTGSGKTRVLQKIRNHVDLEELANHRGSAFGPRGEQPAQITFENQIALRLMKLQGQKIVLEDESATLGKLTVPKRIFKELRSSSLIILEVDPEERIRNIFNDYVKNSNLDFFLHNLTRIQKKLGVKKFESISSEMKQAFSKDMDISAHEGWISILMSEYYDPLYQKDLRYNQEKIIFRGKKQEVLAFLESY